MDHTLPDGAISADMPLPYGNNLSPHNTVQTIATLLCRIGGSIRHIISIEIGQINPVHSVYFFNCPD